MLVAHGPTLSKLDLEKCLEMTMVNLIYMDKNIISGE